MPPILHPRNLIDRFGALGSLVCAVHCALLPLAIAVLPSLGIAAWLGDGFERGFVIFATLIGLFSVLWGYRRHGAARALGLLLPGLAALWIGTGYDPWHHSLVLHAALMTTGGTLVGLAHFANLRLNHGHLHGADDQCCASTDPKIPN
jgi:hypothetical protein